MWYLLSNVHRVDTLLVLSRFTIPPVLMLKMSFGRFHFKSREQTSKLKSLTEGKMKCLDRTMNKESSDLNSLERCVLNHRYMNHDELTPLLQCTGESDGRVGEEGEGSGV